MGRAVLLGSGLRVSELLGLKREQYNGRGFTNVLVKGGRIREFAPVQSQARQVLEECFSALGNQNGLIFITRTGKALSRSQMFEILQRVAEQANAYRPDGQRIEVSPHVLRHTFLRKLAEEKGVHYAKEASCSGRMVPVRRRDETPSGQRLHPTLEPPDQD